jgi:hypothetical protein
MALDDKPWWGKNHSLYGGETFTSKDTKPKLGIVTGDRFRVEKKGTAITLAPHAQNQGTLRDSDNEKKPIKMKKVTAPQFDRVYSMEVMVTEGSNPPAAKEFFFVERMNGSTAIQNSIAGPGAGDGTASVER